MVVPFEESVPPQRYGGIELVVGNLIEELVEMGHSVTLFGTADSETPAELVPIFPLSTRQLPQSANKLSREAYTYLGISRILQQINDIGADIIHNHLGWQFMIFRSQVKARVLTTLHLSLEDTEQRLILLANRRSAMVSISHAQRSIAPDLNYAGNVYNGIKVHRFRPKYTPGSYLAFLGSIIPHKGPDIAIQIAKQTGRQLLIGAKIDPLQVHYFETEVRPHIDSDQIVFLGEVDHEQKNELLMNAEALLMPIRWNEPFGLVVTEALACGTPVIGIRRGALSEIIDDGVTGFLCDNPQEMVKRIADIPSLSREACRQVAEQRFTARLMAEQYANIYKRLLLNRSR